MFVDLVRYQRKSVTRHCAENVPDVFLTEHRAARIGWVAHNNGGRVIINEILHLLQVDLPGTFRLNDEKKEFFFFFLGGGGWGKRGDVITRIL